MTRAVLVTAVMLLAAVAPADVGEVHSARAPAVDAAPPGPSVEARLAEIQRRIQAALIYPPVARWHKLEGETLVRFEIAHDGEPQEIRVHRSSGAGLLDRAAEGAVAAAAPLPWVYGLLEVPVRFDLDERR